MLRVFDLIATLQRTIQQLGLDPNKIFAEHDREYDRALQKTQEPFTAANSEDRAHLAVHPQAS